MCVTQQSREVKSGFARFFENRLIAMVRLLLFSMKINNSTWLISLDEFKRLIANI